MIRNKGTNFRLFELLGAKRMNYTFVALCCLIHWDLLDRTTRIIDIVLDKIITIVLIESFMFFYIHEVCFLERAYRAPNGMIILRTFEWQWSQGCKTDLFVWRWTENFRHLHSYSGVECCRSSCWIRKLQWTWPTGTVMKCFAVLNMALYDFLCLICLLGYLTYTYI